MQSRFFLPSGWAILSLESKINEKIWIFPSTLLSPVTKKLDQGD